MPKGGPGIARVQQPLEERFWALVTVRGYDECWPWTGAQRKGYGSFKLSIGQLGAPRRKDVYAHRVAFRLVHGRWPEPCGLHGCDNPVCCNAVNPQHIHDGTWADNNRECRERGRYWQPSGTANHNSSLSEGDIITIMALGRSERLPQHAIGAMFGISQPSVSRILRGERYAAEGRR